MRDHCYSYNFVDWFSFIIIIIIVELNVEPHANLNKNFKFESNLIVAELEFEPEPCDIVWINDCICWLYDPSATDSTGLL